MFFVMLYNSINAKNSNNSGNLVRSTIISKSPTVGLYLINSSSGILASNKYFVVPLNNEESEIRFSLQRNSLVFLKYS